MNQNKADPIRAGVLSVNDFCQWTGIGRTAFYAELKARRLMARKFEDQWGQSRTDPVLAPDLVDCNPTIGFLQNPYNLAFRKSRFLHFETSPAKILPESSTFCLSTKWGSLRLHFGMSAS